MGKQGLRTGSDVHQCLMVEEPASAGQDVGLMSVDFIDHRSCILACGGGYGHPFIIRVTGHLCMEGRECQR